MDASISPEKWCENEEVMLKTLETMGSWDNIPLLNVNDLHNLKDKSLVRFHGMIQDMHSPEYYLEKFEITNKTNKETALRCGKYTDAAIGQEDETIDFDSDKNVTSERQTYVIISVPALNDWAKDVEVKKYQIIQDKPASSNKQLKRALDDEMETEETVIPITSTDNIQKRQCITNTTPNTSNGVVSTDHILNFPLPERTGKVCHLKVYKNTDELKLNDLCEFVGFLSVDPSLSEISNNDNEGVDEMEIQTLHPPPSLVPRIHCVAFKKLKHSNPLVDEESMDLEKIQFLRRELLIVLTQLLLGDELAAEYVLLHMMSEVYLRRDFMALGKFSLNISNVPIMQNLDYIQELYKFIELLVPKSHYLPMTLDNMNDLAFTPKKDYECNRLTSGILQLSSNTHLVLDETKLSAGKLNPAGVNSVKAIACAIKNQKVQYDFNYYPIEYDSDIPFLIMSEGKSLLPSDCHVVLKPEKVCLETFSEIVEAAKHFLKPELLNDIRTYLTISRLTEYEISDNIQELVQAEFVNMRQNGKVSADDLHSLLVLARLICISHGKSTLDDVCWKQACNLEQRRKARLPQ